MVRQRQWLQPVRVQAHLANRRRLRQRIDNDVSAVANNETPVSDLLKRMEERRRHERRLAARGRDRGARQRATSTAGAEAFYKKPGMLFDVTEGSNGTCTPAEHSYFCTAEAGYDGPTGLGTPNGVFHLSGWADQTVRTSPQQTNTKTSSLLGCVVRRRNRASLSVIPWVTRPRNPLAENWNGTAWSVQESPEQQEPPIEHRVCIRPVCTAVGHDIEGSGREEIIAEHWNGAVWSIEQVASAPKRSQRLEPDRYRLHARSSTLRRTMPPRWSLREQLGRRSHARRS